MTSVQTIQKEISRIKEKTAFKPGKVILVHKWRPNGKDVPYDGGPVRIKALKEPIEKSE